jgi:hypothetical protein
MIKLHGSADGLLPPVRRVKTLDLSKKAPISRTDFVNDIPTSSGYTPGDSDINMVPIHQDITDSDLDTNMVTANQDSYSNQSARDRLPIHQNNSCCENELAVVNPAYLESKKQNSGRTISLQDERSHHPSNGSILSQTVAFSNVLNQIQEVFDLTHVK